MPQAYDTKTIEPASPKPMTKVDDSTFGALMFKEISEMARDAAKTADRQKMLAASKLAYQKTQAATLEVRRAGALTPELTLSVDGAYEALWELWAAVANTADAPTYGYLTERSIDLIDTTCVPLHWRKPQGPEARNQRASTAARAGAMTVSTSDRGNLGRLHMENARRTITTNWTSIKTGRFDVAISDATADLFEAQAMLNDPNVAIADLASEVRATDELVEKLTLELTRQGRSFSLLTDLARNQDGLLALAKQPPRWTQTVDANVKAHTAMEAPINKNEKEETLLIPPMHYERYIVLTNSGRGQQELGRLVVSLTAKLYPDGQVSVIPSMRAELIGEARNYLNVMMEAQPPVTYSLPSGEHKNRTILKFSLSGPAVTETETASATVGGNIGKLPVGGEGAVSGGAGVANSTAVASRGTVPAMRGFEFTGDAATKRISMIEMPDQHTDIHSFLVTGEDRGKGIWSPVTKTDWAISSH